MKIINDDKREIQKAYEIKHSLITHGTEKRAHEAKEAHITWT